MDLNTWIAVGSEMDEISVKVLTMSDANARALLQLGQRSKFPARHAPPLNNAVVHSNASRLIGSPAAYSFTYRVYVSVFAPFDYFGPFSWSRGDGAARRFGTNPAAGYRLQALSTVTTSPGGGDFPFSVTKVSDPTTSYLINPMNALKPSRIGKALANNQSLEEMLTDEEKSEGYLNDAYGEFRPSGVHSESDSTRYHLHGNDDAFALWGDNSLFTSDIDVHPYFETEYFPQADLKEIQMRISGKIIGDQFPAVEAFVLDLNNNGVMLGVWQVRAGDGPVFTREGYRGIIGDKQLPMFDFDVTILVKNGIFTDVVKNSGRLASLAEHNKQYTSLPTVSGSLPTPPSTVVRPATHY